MGPHCTRLMNSQGTVLTKFMFAITRMSDTLYSMILRNICLKIWKLTEYFLNLQKN